MSEQSVSNSSVAANTVTANLLAGESVEFPGRNSIVELQGTAAAAGVNVFLQIGQRVLMDFQEISAANRFPESDKDVILQAGAAAGERIILKAHNTTAGALVVILRLMLRPV